MIFSRLLTNVKRLIQDSGIRWDDTTIAEYLVPAVNETRRKTGAVTSRTTMSLVQSQTEYVITTPGRILNIKIIPENSIEAIDLPQVPIGSIPVAADSESDPTLFGLNVNAGTDENQQAITMFPPPARSTSGAIVIEQAEDWEFTSDATASAPQLATVIPILEKFDMPITRLVAGQLLIEQNDDSAVQKGMFWINKAEGDIANLAYVNTLSHWTNPLGRNFP